MQTVLALMDTASEATLVHGDPREHAGPTRYVNVYRDGEEVTTEAQVKLAIGKSVPFMATVLISHVPEYIIGIDLLRGKGDMPLGYGQF